MRLSLISDTHALHRSVKVPKCDVLIHAGDISDHGELSQVTDFLNWFHNQDATHKIFIAGNHELSFEDPVKMNKIREIISQHSDIIYLQDESVTIDGIKIYGTPWQPWFYNWAFNVQRGEEIAKIWAKIPEDTDILVTHGPPMGYGDQIYGRGKHLGCEDLYKRILEVKPKLVICGHIHSGHGDYQLGDDIYVINAAVLDEQYMLAYDPVTLNYEDFVLRYTEEHI